METLSLSIFAVALAVLTIAPEARAERPLQTRRFSLVAGANDGGDERVRLRYAGSDAMAMAKVLGELGGVASQDQLLLLEPDRASLQRGLAAMRQRLQEASAGGDRVELFFYYSGHSDEEGLLLGQERFGYGELRQALDELPAEVRVAILDSCASGALTRRKGGVSRPPFLMDASSSVKGHAFLTASAADEAAQESDRIGASFFTHHLVSGLRGAADASGRGRVTLNEAYAYAFRETLSQTERTQHGAQHPGYEMQLVGSGDLVITDLRATSAGLILDESVSGRIFVRDASGALVVEVKKQREAPLELGLAPGDYAITVDDKGALFEARITLVEGRRATLDRSQLGSVTAEATLRRGDDPESPAGDPGYTVVPLSQSLLPDLSSSQRTLNRVGLHLIAGRATKLDGFQLSLGANLVDEEVDGSQVTLGANFAGGDLDGAQIAIGFNGTGGKAGGLQMSIGANHAGTSASGVQLSIGANAADLDLIGLQAAVGANVALGSAEGVQVAVGANYAGRDVLGLQASSGANVARGSINGLQVASGFNYAGGVEGAQVAAVANYADRVDGAQVAQGINYASRVDGAQVALVNLADGIDGAQVGLLNVAEKVSGFQLGLLNFADDSDTSIGVLSFVRNGRFNLELSASDVNVANLGIKLGTRNVYTLFTAGLSPGRDEPAPRWTTGIGLGVQLRFDQAFLDFLDIDVSSSSMRDGATWISDNLLNVLRIGAGWQLAPRFALVVGPTLNVYTGFNGKDRDDLGFIPGLHYEGTNPVHIWPGFFASVQI